MIYNHQLCVLEPQIWGPRRQGDQQLEEQVRPLLQIVDVIDRCGGFFTPRPTRRALTSDRSSSRVRRLFPHNHRRPTLGGPCRPCDRRKRNHQQPPTRQLESRRSTTTVVPPTARSTAAKGARKAAKPEVGVAHADCDRVRRRYTFARRVDSPRQSNGVRFIVRASNVAGRGCLASAIRPTHLLENGCRPWC